LHAGLGGDDVPGLRSLAHTPDEHPGAAEDARHLQLEQVWIGVDVAVHAPGRDQPGDVLGIAVAHGQHSRSKSALEVRMSAIADMRWGPHRAKDTASGILGPAFAGDS